MFHSRWIRFLVGVGLLLAQQAVAGKVQLVVGKETYKLAPSQRDATDYLIAQSASLRFESGPVISALKAPITMELKVNTELEIRFVEEKGELSDPVVLPGTQGKKILEFLASPEWVKSFDCFDFSQFVSDIPFSRDKDSILGPDGLSYPTKDFDKRWQYSSSVPINEHQSLFWPSNSIEPGQLVALATPALISGREVIRTIHFAIYIGRGFYLSKMGKIEQLQIATLSHMARYYSASYVVRMDQVSLPPMPEEGPKEEEEDPWEEVGNSFYGILSLIAFTWFHS